MSGFKFKFGIGFNSGGEYIAPPLDLSLYKFTTWQPTTNIDGTREIVNEGSANNLTLYSGSGTSFNGTNQSVDGFVLPIDATHMIYLKDNVKVYTTTLIDFSTIVSVGTYKDVYCFNRALTTAEQDKYTSQPEQFYIDALADNTCVLNMPMNDKDSYARDMSSYSEGVERVTNGTFDTDTEWTKGTGWEISNGSLSTTTATSITTYQNINAVSGETWLIEWDIIEYTAGVMACSVGGNIINYWKSSAGSYSKIVVASASGNIEVKCSGFEGKVDNVSAKILSGIYPKLNYTTDQNISNLQYGTQDLKLPHDDLGLRDGTITPWIKGDGVSYADTGWTPLSSDIYTIEYIYYFDSTEGTTRFGSSNNGYILGQADNGTIAYNRVGNITYTYLPVVSDLFHHIIMSIGEAEVNTYVDGVLASSNGNTPTSDCTESFTLLANRKASPTEIQNTPLKLFKVHDKALTQEEVTTAYNDAVNKGLLNV